MAVAETFEEYRSELLDPESWRYKHSQGRSTYSRDEGLLVIPVMGAAGTLPVILRVHAPIGYRNVQFASAKAGMPPIFPPQADTASGDKILVSDLTFPFPRPGMDGNLTFGVSGEYQFVQAAEVRGPESKYPIDDHPFPSMVRFMELLPPPSSDTLDDGGWHWNTRYVDARLLGAYNLLG